MNPILSARCPCVSVFLYFCLTLAVGLIGCSTAQNHPAALPVRYHNTKYDLTFYLPDSWRGYSVVMQQWDGQTYSPALDKAVAVEHGPMIVLRNPKWKPDDQYQDIPIYVFNRTQWDDMHLGKFDAAGAGGIICELWHHDKFVFGIHSRTFGFDTQLNDWRETADIVDQNCAVHRTQHLYPE
jgi:hypothetical protein